MKMTSILRAAKLFSIVLSSLFLSACITQVVTIPAKTATQAASQSAQTAGQTAGQAAQIATGGDDEAKKAQRNNP